MPKCPANASQAAPRPRKKQAVTKTSSAATKALILQNATDSPLLRLGPEILENILSHLLGNKLALIKYKEFRPYTPYNVGPWGLHHVIYSSDDAHPDNAQPRLHLTVLAASRQLYQQGNHILWTTNTFAFDHAESFTKIISSLTTAQKRKLTSLKFSVDIHADSGWSAALNLRTLTVLRGARKVQLCLHQSHINGVLPNRCIGTREKKREVWQRSTAAFLRLRALPLEQVAVTLSDDGLDLANRGILWTAEKKLHAAELFRTALLEDSGGMEVVRASIRRRELEELSRDVANPNSSDRDRDRDVTRMQKYKKIGVTDEQAETMMREGRSVVDVSSDEDDNGE